MESTLDTTSESEIFSRVIGGGDALPPAVAKSVLSWKFPRRDLARIRKLQERNNAGTITAAERDELGRFIHVGQFIAVLQARARLALKSNGET